jgi:hypothetical protein
MECSCVTYRWCFFVKRKIKERACMHFTLKVNSIATRQWQQCAGQVVIPPWQAYPFYTADEHLLVWEKHRSTCLQSRPLAHKALEKFISSLITVPSSWEVVYPRWICFATSSSFPKAWKDRKIQHMLSKRAKRLDFSMRSSWKHKDLVTI